MENFKMEKETVLEYVMGLYFHVNHSLSIEDVKKYLQNPNLLERANEFKKQLASAIVNSSITPQKFERLTAEEFETQEEVNNFLKTEIWQPLYGDEPMIT